MVGILASTVLCGSAAAEYQDRLFGNGRFLRRIRDDLTGKPTPKKPTPANASSKSKSKTPTPARRPSSAKKPNSKSPTLANRSGKTPTPTVRPLAATNRTPAIAGPAGSKASKRSAKKATIGFGMLLESKGDAIVVTKIDSRGNAKEAGLKAGDVIQGAGGVDLTSIEEFNEISDILGSGDQLEFTVARRGKTKDILIQFGTAPDEGEVAKTPAPKKENNYSFVPERVDNSQTGLRSVLNQPAVQTKPTTTNPRGQQNGLRPASVEQRLISEQRLQIQQMQQEIQRLKQRSQMTPRIVPAETTPPGKTILEGPSLSGPGN